MESGKNRPALVIKGIDFWRKVEYGKGKIRRMKIPSSMFEVEEGRYCGTIAIRHWKENSLWQIRIEKSDNRLFMTKGLNKFCKHFNVNHGSILWFEYESRHKFLVKIGSRNGISYNPQIDKVSVADQMHGPGTGQELTASRAFVTYIQTDSIFIPNELVESCSLEKIEDCTLRLSNCIQFSVRFNPAKRQLERLEQFLSFLPISKFWPVVVEYAGQNSFQLTLFSSDGLEHNQLTPENSGLERIMDNAVERHGVSESRDYASFIVFGQTYEKQPIFYEIMENSIKRLSIRNKGDPKGFDMGNMNQLSGRLWLNMGFNSYPMSFEYRNGELCFVKGWTTYCQKNNLKPGEILAVQPKKGSLMFETCVISNCLLQIQQTTTQISKDWIATNFTFISIINYCSLHTGKIAIPFRIYAKIGSSLPRNCICVLADGSTINVNHSENQRGLFGFRSLFVENKIFNSDVVVVSHLGNGLFKMRAFKSGGLEILLKGNREGSENTQKRKDIGSEDVVRNCVKKKARAFSGDDASEHGGVNTMELKRGTTSDGHPDQVTDDVLDQQQSQWEIVVKPSHLDRIVHGVHVSILYKSITKRWKNRDTITLNCDVGNFELVVKRKNGRITIHDGWTNFVEMVKPKVGDRCVFNCDEVPNHYGVEIIPALKD